MRVLRGAWRDWSVERPTALAIGVFDGVHRGHRAVLTAFQRAAADRALDPGVVTFDRHPLALLAPERAPKSLSTIEQRIEIFAGLGARVVAVLPFDDDLRSMAPEGFVSDILSVRLRARFIVVGEDFRFGENRGGDPILLRSMGEQLGFEVEVLGLVGDAVPISSTRIRERLAAGDVESAAELLGRRYQLHGEVVSGKGRSLVTGAPTANIDVPVELAIPRRGVYAAFAGVEVLEPAVVNVGVRPTFGGDTETIEVHLLDQDRDLSGQLLRVDFVKRLRDESAFFDGEALAAQIEVDIAAARDILATQTP